MLLSRCAVRDTKTLKCNKEQEASELLSGSEIKTFLCKTSLEDPLCFRSLNALIRDLKLMK